MIGLIPGVPSCDQLTYRKKNSVFLKFILFINETLNLLNVVAIVSPAGSVACSNCAKHTVKSHGCWSAYNTQWRPAVDCQSGVSGSSAYCRMLRPCNPPQTIVDVRIEGRLSPVGLLLPCARAFKCTEG